MLLRLAAYLLGQRRLRLSLRLSTCKVSVSSAEPGSCAGALLRVSTAVLAASGVFAQLVATQRLTFDGACLWLGLGPPPINEENSSWECVLGDGPGWGGRAQSLRGATALCISASLSLLRVRLSPAPLRALAILLASATAASSGAEEEWHDCAEEFDDVSEAFTPGLRLRLRMAGIEARAAPTDRPEARALFLRSGAATVTSVPGCLRVHLLDPVLERSPVASPNDAAHALLIASLPLCDEAVMPVESVAKLCCLPSQLSLCASRRRLGRGGGVAIRLRLPPFCVALRHGPQEQDWGELISALQALQPVEATGLATTPVLALQLTRARLVLSRADADFACCIAALDVTVGSAQAPWLISDGGCSASWGSVEVYAKDESTACPARGLVRYTGDGFARLSQRPWCTHVEMDNLEFVCDAKMAQLVASAQSLLELDLRHGTLELNGDAGACAATLMRSLPDTAAAQTGTARLCAVTLSLATLRLRAAPPAVFAAAGVRLKAAAGPMHGGSFVLSVSCTRARLQASGLQASAGDIEGDGITAFVCMRPPCAVFPRGIISTSASIRHPVLVMSMPHTSFAVSLAEAMAPFIAAFAPPPSPLPLPASSAKLQLHDMRLRLSRLPVASELRCDAVTVTLNARNASLLLTLASVHVAMADASGALHLVRVVSERRLVLSLDATCIYTLRLESLELSLDTHADSLAALLRVAAALTPPELPAEQSAPPSPGPAKVALAHALDDTIPWPAQPAEASLAEEASLLHGPVARFYDGSFKLVHDHVPRALLIDPDAVPQGFPQALSRASVSLNVIWAMRGGPALASSSQVRGLRLSFSDMALHLDVMPPGPGIPVLRVSGRCATAELDDISPGCERAWARVMAADPAAHPATRPAGAPVVRFLLRAHRAPGLDGGVSQYSLEHSLHVEILPLRLMVDQSALRFAGTFAADVGAACAADALPAPSAAQPAYVRELSVGGAGGGPLLVRVDFRPAEGPRDDLRPFAPASLLMRVPWAGVELALPVVRQLHPPGAAAAAAGVAAAWAADAAEQGNAFLRGVPAAAARPQRAAAASAARGAAAFARTLRAELATGLAAAATAALEAAERRE